MDQVERLRAELAEARRQARTDPLTEAWNRRAIIELLYRELERARREGGRVGVLFVDLDRFKRINDSRGHAAGDAVLREAAARMRAAVRPYDPVGRYGGDEFVVIVAGAGAERGAERAATAIAAGLRGAGHRQHRRGGRAGRRARPGTADRRRRPRHVRRQARRRRHCGVDHSQQSDVTMPDLERVSVPEIDLGILVIRNVAVRNGRRRSHGRRHNAPLLHKLPFAADHLLQPCFDQALSVVIPQRPDRVQRKAMRWQQRLQSSVA